MRSFGTCIYVLKEVNAMAATRRVFNCVAIWRRNKSQNQRFACLFEAVFSQTYAGCYIEFPWPSRDVAQLRRRREELKLARNGTASKGLIFWQTSAVDWLEIIFCCHREKRWSFWENANLWRYFRQCLSYVVQRVELLWKAIWRQCIINKQYNGR